MTAGSIVVLGIIFGLLGASVDGGEGFLVGAALGILTGLSLGLRSKFRLLEQRVRGAEQALERLISGEPESGPALEASASIAPTNSIELSTSELRASSNSTDPTLTRASAGAAAPAAAPSPWLSSTGEKRPAPGVEFADQVAEKLKSFFTTGNVVVKVGIVILFFGVSFLIKYAHDRGVLPIELRLSGLAALGVVLLAFGWRLRQAKPAYAMVLQGGAIGILYLTVFGAARLYHVLPMGLAFALMILFVILSGFLAVLQNAPALAAFGSAGGFLAPVLTSTGQGSHVALFSYYALLNLGIFGIAWFKAWRGLNWLGFIFTFVIATLWGAHYYQAEYFATTEPFLVLFVLFYIGISILFARRQPPQLRGIVDGSLVFGVPSVAFALQSRLMRGIEFGLAYSALALGAVYIALAYFLLRRYRVEMRLLSEAFLALGVIFTSLAIPLALDGHWTAAAWSLEGAGIIWLGCRQQRILPRVFGLILLFGGAALFLLDVNAQSTAPLVVNSVYLGAVMIALAGLVSAYLFGRFRENLHLYERALEVLLIGWGLVWWFASGMHEIANHSERAHLTAWLIVFSAASAISLAFVAHRLNWQRGKLPAIGLLPALGFFAGWEFALHPQVGPFGLPYVFAWTFALASQYGLLARFGANWKPRLTELWHAGSLWLVTFLITWGATVALIDTTGSATTWIVAMTGLVPSCVVFALLYWGERLAWPVAEFPSSYRYVGLVPIIAYLIYWLLRSVYYAGDPVPLSYISVLNPIELVGGAVLLATLSWWRFAHSQLALPEAFGRYVLFGFGLLCFVWFNAVLFRTIHHTTGTPYELSVMWRSPTLQSTISLAWTVLGCALMAIAALKLKLRVVWIAGAIILGLVVAKLFVVDFADIGTVPRIVSFMGVGLLLLVIGYFAPLPPRAEVAESA